MAISGSYTLLAASPRKNGASRGLVLSEAERCRPLWKTFFILLPPSLSVEGGRGMRHNENHDNHLSLFEDSGAIMLLYAIEVLITGS